MVLITSTTYPEPIESFSLRVAEAWKIGRKGVDDGMLIAIATSDRAMRLEVGYGLEGVITDAMARRLIEEVFAPAFRDGEFAQGLNDGIDSLMRVIDGEPLPEPARSQPGDGDLRSLETYFVLFIGDSFCPGWRVAGLLGRLPAAGLIGAGTGFLAWLIAAPILLAVLVGAIGFVLVLFGGSVAGDWAGTRAVDGVGAREVAAFAAVVAVLAGAVPRDAGEMSIKRWLRHLMLPRWVAGRRFPPATLARIERAVSESELRHGGQIRLAVESCPRYRCPDARN